MKGSQHYQWAITPLSPVHIGCGQVYEPTNYVAESNLLYEFDPSTIAQVLSPKDRADLLEIVSKRGSTDMILAVQRFFMTRKTKIIPLSVQQVPLSIAVADLYRKRAGQVAADQGHDRRIFNRLAINRTAYLRPHRAPYLPGSSIKGAIRTALLHEVNQGAKAQQKEIEDKRRGGLHQLQGRLLNYRRQEKLKLECDPLRQLRIGDANPAGSTLPTRRAYMATNRHKAPKMQREQGNGPRTNDSSPDQYLECILPQTRGFFSEIEVQDVQAALGSDSHRWADKLPSWHFSMKEIANACNAFYRPILEAEIQEMQQQGLLDTLWVTAVQEFLQHHQSRVDSGEAFLVRVGHHSGAESVTLPGMRHILIKKGRGSADTKENATTWWLGAELEKAQKTGLLPFGWIFVELREWTSRDQEWGTAPVAFSWTPPKAEPDSQATSTITSAEVVWTQVRLKYNKANGAITAQKENESATVVRPESDRILEGLSKDIQKKLSDNQCFAKFTVTVQDRSILSVKPE